MAAYAVTEYQAIVARTIEPQQTAVLTVGSIQAMAAESLANSRTCLTSVPAVITPAYSRFTPSMMANIRWDLRESYGPSCTPGNNASLRANGSR